MCLLQYQPSHLSSDADKHGAVMTGRHPLAELVMDTFIPNDTTMQADAARVQVRLQQQVSFQCCYQMDDQMSS